MPQKISEKTKSPGIEGLRQTILQDTRYVAHISNENEPKTGLLKDIIFLETAGASLHPERELPR